MSTRPVWLIKIRPGPRQRAHFWIFIPFPQHSSQDPNDKTQQCRGTVIHVVGTPIQMALQFKSNVPCNATKSFEAAVRLGDVDESLVVDRLPAPSRPDEVTLWETPSGRLEREARYIQPPRGGNLLAPVNDETNRRCQEWTMDYLRHLVRKRLIDARAIEIAHAQRDPPAFGIGLRPVPPPQPQAPGS